MSAIILEIPDIFQNFIDPALLRFQYLFPKVSVTRNDKVLTITTVDEYAADDLKKEVLHLIYKEKIYSETLEIRSYIYQTLAANA